MARSAMVTGGEPNMTNAVEPCYLKLLREGTLARRVTQAWRQMC